MKNVSVFCVAHTGQFLVEVAGMEAELWALEDTQEKAMDVLRETVRWRWRKLYREMGLAS